MRILVLEDDPATAGAVVDGLRERGYEVLHAADALTARELAELHPFDAAVLDLMVPKGGGYSALEALRARSPGLPVLILTARDSVADRVEGLERGADDYLVKPFAFVELAARLAALLRRPQTRVEALHIADLEIDPLHRRALHQGHPISLTPKEFELLWCLARQKGEILTRKELLESVWGYRFDPGTNVVDVHVTRLRRKLEASGAADLIRTVRGIGYALVA
ncbi:MAG TPA: response regulator transcription factor [Myxococcota bacterium]|nr:response regulator transcription factor [Myxococcota bacterium]